MDEPIIEASRAKLTAESDTSTYTDRVPAVDQATRILYFLAAGSRGQATLTEICRGVGIYKSKGRALLNTLIEAKLVSKNEQQKTFSLGPGLLVLSRALLDQSELPAVSAPHLEKLAVTPGTCAFLAAIRGSEVYVIARREAPGGLGVSIRVGYHYPLTWGSIGKALVAFLPVEEREVILTSSPLYFYGDPGNGGDLQGVRAELAQVRRLGYGADIGAIQAGLNAVSAPLLAGRQEERPVGALTLYGTFAQEMVALHGERVSAVAREMQASVAPLLEGML